MSKLHWDAETIFGLAGMPDWANYAAIDRNKKHFWYYENDPKLESIRWMYDIGRCGCVHLETDYTGDWKYSLLERPKVIKPGDFGKFWDDEEDCALYGYLSSIKDYMNYPYFVGNKNYKYFKKIDPATLPKEIEI